MTERKIHIIDLKFHSRSGTIAAYLVPYSKGCILIETGPGSTIQNLLDGISQVGYGVKDISDVFLTHIHLDHAGAAGWFSQQGAVIHVHENGAPHLVNPERLLSSAGRIYGDQMEMLWGKFLPVPSDRIAIMHDGEIIKIGDISIRALDTPGHAIHHLAYFLGDTCFSGDIGGIRLTPKKYLSLPMPPPDLNIEKWRESIQYIHSEKPKVIVPTHFGMYEDAEWHLQGVLDVLAEVERWMEEKLSQNPPIEVFRQQFIEFEQERIRKHDIQLTTAETQQIANPSSFSADGILRYWNKFRLQAWTRSDNC